MKCEKTNTILIFAVGFFVVLDVLFAIRAINGQRDFRALQIGMNQSQAGLMQLQQLQTLFIDAREYNRLHPNPELTRILDTFQANVQAKPATH